MSKHEYLERLHSRVLLSANLKLPGAERIIIQQKQLFYKPLRSNQRAAQVFALMLASVVSVCFCLQPPHPK